MCKAEGNCQDEDSGRLLLEMDGRCYQYELESSEEDRKHKEQLSAGMRTPSLLGLE